MSYTKKIIQAGPTHGGKMQLGGDGEKITIPDGCALRRWPIEAITPAGSAQGNATALVEGHLNIVTGADGTKGVVLPAADEQREVAVYSATATNGLKIYPAADDDIDDGTADAAITIEGKTSVLLVSDGNGTWVTLGGYTANT